MHRASPDIASIAAKGTPLNHYNILKGLTGLALKLDVQPKDPLVSSLAVVDKRRREVGKILETLSNKTLEDYNRDIKNNIDILDKVKTKAMYRDVETYKEESESIAARTAQLSANHEGFFKVYKTLISAQFASLPELIKQYKAKKLSMSDVNGVMLKYIREFQEFNSSLSSHKHTQIELRKEQDKLFDITSLELGKQGITPKGREVAPPTRLDR